MTTATFNRALDAFAALAATKHASKAANTAAFRASALATFTAVSEGRGAAAALAAANKEAGVGYGSDAAVGFHALTGQWLTLPVVEGEKVPSAESVQAQIKKAGQKKVKAILKRKDITAGAAWEAIKAAAVADFDPVKTLEAAFALVQQVEEWRVSGHAFGDDFDVKKALNGFRNALDNIEPVRKPVIEIVKGKATVNA